MNLSRIVAALPQYQHNTYIGVLLEFIDNQAEQIRSLTMRADCADWAAQELTDENTALLLTIASRDQWADQLTEQYATREAEFKAVLQDLLDPRYTFYNDFSRNDWLFFKANVTEHAIKLNITLD